MVKSTRSNHTETVSKAILEGLAPDSGLYVFDNIEKIDLEKLKGLSYQEITEVIFEQLLQDYSKEDISQIINNSYNDSHFSPSPVTIKANSKFAYLNLYNGNTFAFKDMALSVLPELIKTAKKMNNIKKSNIILTATSGDTGGAALSGFSNNPNDYVIVLYPTVGVSEFQEIQMNNFASEHSLIFAVDGNFDDCQNIVKKVFQEVKPNNIHLTSANSINIGRIIPQIVYYIYSYVTLLNKGKISKNDQINFCVPTGNFGNIYAASLSKKLGVPINKLIIATNENNVIHDFFKTGIYNIDRNLKKTISPSMDIIISSNLERYIYCLLDGNYNKVKEIMDTLKTSKSVYVKEILNNKLFYSNMATEEETLKTIRKVYETENELIDPHTAVAKTVYEKYLKDTNDTSYTVLVSTASPYKFSDSVLKALTLEKQNSLIEDLKYIALKTNVTLDERIDKTITKSINKILLKKDETFTYLKKIIGEIDEN